MELFLSILAVLVALSCFVALLRSDIRDASSRKKQQRDSGTQTTT